MSDPMDDVAGMLDKFRGLVCSHVSVSKYGAIQLGFGRSVDYLIAGKFIKKRFEVEVGCYDSNWGYTSAGSSEVLHPGFAGQEIVRSQLCGDVVEYIQAVGNSVVLKSKSGAQITFDGNGLPGDIFYAHLEGELGIFYNPSSGWSRE